MTTAAQTVAYTERKPLSIFLAVAIPFLIGIVASTHYHYSWLAIILGLLYFLVVTHLPFEVTVTDREVFVRSLLGTKQHSLREMTNVTLKPALAAVLRLEFRSSHIEISGFTNTQLSNLHRAISAARELALQEAAT